MLDARTVAENLEEIRRALARRSQAASQSLDGFRELAQRRGELITTTERLQARRNAANQEMTQLAKGGDKAAFQARRDELKTLSDEIKQSEQKLGELLAEMEQRLLLVPNVPHASVPDGNSSEDNSVVRTWGEKPSYDFRAESPLGSWRSPEHS